MHGKEADTELSVDEDIAYINRMREEISAAENTPNDIAPPRRRSALNSVSIPEGMQSVTGQDNALGLMKRMRAVFDVEINYHCAKVEINWNTAVDGGWGKETLKNKSTGEITENLVNYLRISSGDANGVRKQTHVIWNKRPE